MQGLLYTSIHVTRIKRPRYHPCPPVPRGRSPHLELLGRHAATTSALPVFAPRRPSAPPLALHPVRTPSRPTPRSLPKPLPASVSRVAAPSNPLPSARGIISSKPWPLRDRTGIQTPSRTSDDVLPPHRRPVSPLRVLPPLPLHLPTVLSVHAAGRAASAADINTLRRPHADARRQRRWAH
ncbi:hypothetical protein BC628DRAFT_1108694 [Trametes gibbosa]|nr:hypothetical protein BC628DRAFT_1108694 [Trametes gibbosa]